MAFEFETALHNLMSHTPEHEATTVIVSAITKMHRTSQQAFFRSLRAALKAYGELPEPVYFDLRNIASRDFAGKMAESVKEDYLPFI